VSRMSLTTVVMGTLLACVAWLGVGRPAYADGGVIYVDAGAPGPLCDGLAWTTAYTELQSALAVAPPGAEIWVAEGTYKPDFDPVSARYTGWVTASFLLTQEVALYGGFAGTESALHQRDWRAHPTILSGDIGAVGILTDNVYHVVTTHNVTETTRLDGFTITSGYANGSGSGSYGGGIYNDSGSLTLVNLMVYSNRANGWHGGGVYNDAGSPTLLNVVFDSNTAKFSGGGLYNQEGSATVVNSVFTHNGAGYRGGGVFNYRANTRFVNVTFCANTAANRGRSMTNSQGSTEIANCIMWGGSGSGQIYNYDTTTPTVRYSLVQGGYAGEGNLSDDPQFVDTASGDLRLAPTSPAVNAGDVTAVPSDTLDLDGDGIFSETLPLDLGGRARVIDSQVDMGAYERHPLTLYVNADAAGQAPSGLSWTAALTELQSALSIAVPGDEIWVAEGTYRPDYDPVNARHTDWMTATFLLDEQVALCGGFAGTESSLEERDWRAHPTILSGHIGDLTQRYDDIWRVVTIRGVTETTRLDGFTITGGHAMEYQVLTTGGGIYNDAASPTLANLIVRANNAYYGGGMYNYRGSPRLLNVVFDDNPAHMGGGGLRNYQASATIVNSVFMNNWTVFFGGGVDDYASHTRFVNVTFYGNIARDASGRSLSSTDGSTEIVNCIMWGGSGNGQIDSESSTVTVRNSLVEGGYEGAGNLDLDPQFVDAANGNLRLRYNSPAIHTGDTAAVPTDTLDLDGDGVLSETLPFDLDGSPRVIGDQVDMGAYELKIGGASNPAPDTWYDFRPDVCAQVYFSDTGSLPAAVTVTLIYSYPSLNGDGLARHYEITTSGGGGFEAQVMLCYEDEDLVEARIDPTVEAGLHIYRFAGQPEWQVYSEVDVVNNLITATGVTEFGVFGIGVAGDHPTFVALRGLVSSAGSPLPGAIAVAGLGLVGFWCLRRRKPNKSRRSLV
jgi:predicted outer membrane repeat protein